MLGRLLRVSKYRFSKMDLSPSQYLNKIKMLQRQKRYEQILQINKNTTASQLKYKYYLLIRKFHSDFLQQQSQKTQIYQQITKIIISSYGEINKSLYPNSKSYSEGYQIENEICKNLFNKTYEQAKYWMFQKGNEKAKDKFFKQLYRKTGRYEQKQAYTTSYTSYSGNQRQNYQQKQSKQDLSFKMLLGLGMVGFVGISMVFFFSSTKKDSYSTPISYRQSQKSYPSSSKDSNSSSLKGSEQMSKNELLSKKKKQKADYLKVFIRDRPRSLKYPFELGSQEPSVFTQLLKYSIAPDIHLYQVPPIYYRKAEVKQKIIKNGIKQNQIMYTNQQQLVPLIHIKPNTCLTLSLEAERALQNVYVKVKDVLDQVIKTGKYVPPQVFFIFHGFIMVQIRDKPITLTNYQNTDYVSLFDLYFEYYSPIFFKRDKFTHYLVNKDDMDNFGWVHLNNRKCQPVYLKSGEKAAFFHAEGKQLDSRNEKIWKHYYYNYQDNWKRRPNST